MNKKPWYKSKAFLSGLGLIALGLLYWMGYLPEEKMSKALETILLGLGLIGVRVAQKPLS